MVVSQEPFTDGVTVQAVLPKHSHAPLASEERAAISQAFNKVNIAVFFVVLELILVFFWFF
jgi:hypothetical protein